MYYIIHTKLSQKSMHYVSVVRVTEVNCILLTTIQTYKYQRVALTRLITRQPTRLTHQTIPANQPRFRKPTSETFPNNPNKPQRERFPEWESKFLAAQPLYRR